MLENNESNEINEVQTSQEESGIVVEKEGFAPASKHSTNDVISPAEFYDWMEIIITALVSVVLVFTLAFRVATIDGSSMVNTLHDKEKVFLSTMGYIPCCGDIVVISRNYNNDPDASDRSSQPIIKRVIATEGQTVSIDFTKGVVYVDGEQLKEDYTNTPTNAPLDFPTDGSVVTVPKGCVFVLGDNRNNSLDSRSNQIGNLGNGMVDTRYIIGKAVLRIFPFTSFGGLY